MNSIISLCRPKVIRTGKIHIEEDTRTAETLKRQFLIHNKTGKDRALLVTQ